MKVFFFYKPYHTFFKFLIESICMFFYSSLQVMSIKLRNIHCIVMLLLQINICSAELFQLPRYLFFLMCGHLSMNNLTSMSEQCSYPDVSDVYVINKGSPDWLGCRRLNKGYLSVSQRPTRWLFPSQRSQERLLNRTFDAHCWVFQRPGACWDCWQQ